MPAALEAAGGLFPGDGGLDVGVPRLFPDHRGVQHLFIERRGLHVDDEAGGVKALGLAVLLDLPADQQARAVAEHQASPVVDEADTIAVAVQAQSDVGVVLSYQLPDGFQERDAFRVRIEVREVPVRLHVARHNLEPQLFEQGHHHEARCPVSRLQRHLDVAGIVQPRLPGFDKICDVLRVGIADLRVRAALSGSAHHVPLRLDELLDKGLEGGDMLRLQGLGVVVSDLHPCPAIGIVAGGYHGASRDGVGVLREVRPGAERESDVRHVDSGSQESHRQRVLHVFRVFSEIVADDDPVVVPHLGLLQEAPQPVAELLHAAVVDLNVFAVTDRLDDPPHVVLAEAKRIDQNFPEVSGGIVRTHCDVS